MENRLAWKDKILDYEIETIGRLSAICLNMIFLKR